MPFLTDHQAHVIGGVLVVVGVLWLVASVPIALRVGRAIADGERKAADRRNDRDIPPHHRPETAAVIADEASEHLRSQP